MARVLKIGTRKSRLAIKQSVMIKEAIEKTSPDVEVELVEYTTTGDKFLGDLSKIGGKGVFIKEIEDALQKGEVDIAMHSMKDMTADLPQEFTLAAVLPRDDIRDVVICREGFTFEGLKEGSRVGTSSLRRASQLRRNFPHLEVLPVRGNVDTRMKKLNDGEFEAIVLAKAGLDRLNLESKIDLVFEPDMMLPALSQGAIGAECRKDDEEVINILNKINDIDTMTCVLAEREMNRLLGGNCRTPIAGYCEVTKGGNLRFIAHVVSPDGKQIIRAREKMAYDDPQALGKVMADDLISQGAEDIIKACESV